MNNPFVKNIHIGTQLLLTDKYGYSHVFIVKEIKLTFSDINTICIPKLPNLNTLFKLSKDNELLIKDWAYAKYESSALYPITISYSLISI
jgi:hypothetical protein